VKARLEKMLGRIRGSARARWPWAQATHTHRGALLPKPETGYTVHHDVALRLRGLPVELPKTPPGTDVGAFKIRLAASHDARRDAGYLVKRRYMQQGYQTSAVREDTNVWTFAAYDEGRLSGTVSLRLDSHGGLAADALYRVELDALRYKGRRLCEFTRLAVDTARLSQPVLAGLFHTVYLFAQQIRNFDFVVIEVNPRHVGFYRRSLGFEVIGPQRHNPRVDAPAVLLGISFVNIALHLRRHAAEARRAPKAKSLYAYGFSPVEEAGVLARLKALDRLPPAKAGGRG
jgi:hypothetical protein